MVEIGGESPDKPMEHCTEAERRDFLARQLDKVRPGDLETIESLMQAIELESIQMT